MILAGDIGGTKCNLALFELDAGRLRVSVQLRYESKNYPRLEDIVAEFVQQTRPAAGAGAAKIAAAAFGVAGPVIQQRAKATNLPWLVDAESLARLLGTERVLLLNDLEASGYSLERLEPSELSVLNKGVPVAEANKAIIAAGTGLGEAILFWEGSRYIVSATEGGHVDFAPRSEQEIELLRYLKKQHAQVSSEYVLSGRGFRLIHEFLNPAVQHPTFSQRDADPAPEITRLGLEGSCPVCVQTLDMWTALYGAEAGNLALKALATAGVYVAGGIAVKILPKLKDGTFFRAFCEKAEFSSFMARIPIYVVMNQDAPLLGAASRAAALAGGQTSRVPQGQSFGGG